MNDFVTCVCIWENIGLLSYTDLSNAETLKKLLLLISPPISSEKYLNTDKG